LKTLTTIYWLRFALGITAAFICIGYGLATGTIPTNLVLNHSVETGTTTPQDWSPSGSVNGTEWSTTYARTGSRSIEINVSSASAEWNGLVGSVTEGSTYQISGFFRGEVTAGQFFLTISWFSDSGRTQFIAENNVSIPVGNYSRWSPLGGDFTAPQRTESCEIAFRAENGTGNVYGDDFEVRQTESYTKIMNGLSLATITYLISYYVIKFRFMHKVEKPGKLLTAGIGIYFLTWIVFWILLYTLIGFYL
jgi:hypothetical protein